MEVYQSTTFLGLQSPRKKTHKKSEPSKSGSGTDEVPFCACLYKQKRGIGQLRLHFVVMKDLEAYRTVSCCFSARKHISKLKKFICSVYR